MIELTTERLLLRPWRDEDRAAFARMNTNAEVLRYFPRPYSAAESDRFVDAQNRSLRQHHRGNWALERLDTGAFIGFTGLSEPASWHPCAGSIEIGWRLAREHWGGGLATEAAERVLQQAFATLALPAVVSFTSRDNAPSIAVMRKLGLYDDGRGFEHPRIDVGHPLRPHVVYRLSRADWLERQP